MDKFLEEAKNNFFKREYKSALVKYSLVLEKAPQNKDAKIGAVLTDMAFDNEEEAMALFEYYEASKFYNPSDAESIIENIIESLSMENLNSIELINALDRQLDMLRDSLTYEEFLDFANERGDFKTALEDAMFNMKIIIYKKEDFIDFINRLLDNNCLELALNYLEFSLLLYPDESFFQKIFNQIQNQNSIENKNRPR